MTEILLLVSQVLFLVFLGGLPLWCAIVCLIVFGFGEGWE
jgi:hypothetical protein